MNLYVKLALYVVFLAGTIAFAVSSNNQYERMLEADVEQSSDLTDVNIPLDESAAEEGKIGRSQLVIRILLTVVFGLGFGVLVAKDVSNFVGQKSVDFVFDHHSDGGRSPEYELAEEAWANNKFMEAIDLLREYFKKNPREIHSALRIAEIYEKDLNNFRAAAMEYEEILKYPLPPKRWGWAAIHLCNIYTGKLNQPEKGIELLQRIVSEHGDTPAAEKAKARLTQLGYELPKPVSNTPGSAAAEGQGSSLPPGFGPKRG